MPVHGRRDRRVGSREDIAMEERRNDLIRVRRERGVGGGGGLNCITSQIDDIGQKAFPCFAVCNL